MLYCNDELVKIKEPEWKYLEQELLEIKKMKAPIRIKSTQKTEINKTGHTEPVPAHSWPLKATVINKSGQTETWIYTDNTPSLKDGELIFTRRSILIDHGLLSLDPQKETEKAYFIIKLSGLLKSGLFEIEDLDKKNSEEVEKLGANSAVEYFICNKYSPLYHNHKKIRQLAASWGIPRTEEIQIDTVRKILVEKVYSSQRRYATTKRGVDEFIKEVNGEDVFSEYRSLIQLAIDKNVLGWNDQDKGWYFMDSVTKSFSQPIVFVSATQFSQKDTILFDLLRLNASLFESIKNEVYQEGELVHEGGELPKKMHWKTVEKLQKEGKL